MRNVHSTSPSGFWRRPLWATLLGFALAAPLRAADTDAIANAAMTLGAPTTAPTAAPTTRPAAQLSPLTPAPTTSTSTSPVIAEGLDSDGRLRLSPNRSKVLMTFYRLRSADHDGAAITAGSADVVTATPVTPTSVLVTAKKQGSTNLILEDDLGRRQLVEISVENDLQELRQQLQDLSPAAHIDIVEDNGSLILHGRVPSLKIADQATQVAAAHAGSPAKVINLLEVSGGQQVMLEVKFAEVSKGAMLNLGVNFGYTDGTTFLANNLGPSPFVTSAADLFAQSLNTSAPGASQIFGNLKFRNSAFNYFVQCMRQNNLLRTLAEPTLTTISGEPANFQVGGQIPIPVPQQGGSGTSGSVITIQYENYGVLLHFTPVVLGDGRIRLNINPQVSDLDTTNGVEISGFNIPGFTTRSLSTTVELADGQTFTVAGLLNSQVSATLATIPGIGDLPVIGSLFRSVQYQRNLTELVVMVTPHVVEAVNPDQVTSAPGEHWRYPSEADMFIARDLGGVAPDPRLAAAAPPPVRALGPAPLFRGQYGFNPTADTRVVEP